MIKPRSAFTVTVSIAVYKAIEVLQRSRKFDIMAVFTSYFLQLPPLMCLGDVISYSKHALLKDDSYDLNGCTIVTDFGLV